MRCLGVLLVNGFGGESLPFVEEMPLVKLQSILSSLFVALAAFCSCLVQVRWPFPDEIRISKLGGMSACLAGVIAR